MNTDLSQQHGDLFGDLCQIIDRTKQSVATTVNSGVTLMYWYVGNRINTETLNDKRAEYGVQIVSTLSTQLHWSHFTEVLPLKDEVQREFYLTMAASEHWSIQMRRDFCRKKVCLYFFLKRMFISSKLLPLVSGMSFHTKMAERMPIAA